MTHIWNWAWMKKWVMAVSKVYAILVHPATNSLNHKLFSVAMDTFKENNVDIDTLDLYQSKFDPWATHKKFKKDVWFPGIKQKIKSYTDKWLIANQVGLIPRFSKYELEKIRSADLLYIQTPLWWWTYPSLLKAYIENVFVYGDMFSLNNVTTIDGTESEHTKALSDKKVLLSFTTGGSEKFMNNYFNSATELCKPMLVQFEFVGYKFLAPHFTWSVGEKTVLNKDGNQDITAMLADLKNKIETTLTEITNESN